MIDPSKNAENIFYFLCSTRVGVLSLTETRLNGDDGDKILDAACPPGFAAFHKQRKEARGGGVAVPHRTSVRVSRAAFDEYNPL